MTKIKIGSRKYTANIHSVRGFCTWASIRVGSKVISSSEYPYGFTGNAQSGLVEAARRSYPGAQLV